MKLLIVTQTVDANDHNLGFFHAWIEQIAVRVDQVFVICLSKGEYHLPKNVTVLSLGKEEKASRWRYLYRFFSYIIQYRKQYDAVLVHMNPEYIILGGPLWRLWRKKIALWYTHKSVNWQLRFAEKIANLIFTASSESFRLPSRKVQVIGHGIDTRQFSFQPREKTAPPLRSLVVGRITPAKDLETMIRAIIIMRNKSIPITLDIYGAAVTPEDEAYEVILTQLSASAGVSAVAFRGGVSHTDLPHIYQEHDVLLHASRTGSLDKVVLEALATGMAVLASGEAYKHIAEEGLLYTFGQKDAEGLASCIEKLYADHALERDEKRAHFVEKNHALGQCVEKIITVLSARI